MQFFIKLFLLKLLLCNYLHLSTAQWCQKYQSVLKTRVFWNNGQRMVSKRNFFGGIKYKYEPYMYSTVQNYHDYERVSVCCDGYTKVSDSKCEPICRPSCPTNTHCIRPNICECDVNYRGYTASALAIQCEPVCLPNCRKNAQCIAPNQCQCNSGYETDTTTGECRPICKQCPANSKCTQPEECTCNAGYLDNGKGECKPVCSKQCPEFAECTRPETCTCQRNYRMNEGECKPICWQECPESSQCIKPDECECLEGYEKANYLNATYFNCLAKCDKGCPLNAECIKPNSCECQQGYKMSSENECQPICESECPQHATCSEPNQCTCDKGYEMIEQQCQAICEKACPEHASCSEPNKCQCEAGYQLKLSSIYNLFCEPICQPNCSTFGKCVQPNKCECLEGYEMDELEVCQPICSRGCNNGLCFQPEICICNPGYLMGPQEKCEPACSLPCQNGSCIEPEICQCHEGYRFKNNSVNICEPICEPQCINGICVAPNVCICHENFEPITTQEGLNHHNCQVIPSTTITTTNEPEYETTTTTAVTQFTDYHSESTTNLLTTLTALDLTSTLNPDQLRQSSASSLSSADICQDRCHCWHEFDEYGPLVSKECVHLCADGFDKPCLDLKLCQCDVAKNHLICQASDDSMEQDDDPLFYMCNAEHFKASTFKPLNDGLSSDMKSVQPQNDAGFPWWWPTIAGVLVVVSVIGGLLYVRFRKFEEPIMEYEL